MVIKMMFDEFICEYKLSVKFDEDRIILSRLDSNEVEFEWYKQIKENTPEKVGMYTVLGMYINAVGDDIKLEIFYIKDD